jgi:CRISPR/Cas system CMR-associated protein Cmr1 (group 7 of RAMP superfamily)
MEIIKGSAKSYLECIPNGCGLMVGQACGKSPNDAIKAWSKAVLALMDFRQRMYRNRGPGRTNWPEPDSIRDITGFSSSAHETPINAATVGTFPRAWFGLPIIFHFQSSGRSAGDPPDITLEPLPDSKADPSERGRMASPIMLRPMYDAAGWRPALLQLPVEHWTSLNCRRHTDDSELLSELQTGNKQIVQSNQLWGSKVAKSKPIADQFPATESQSGANAIVAFTRFLKKHHGFDWAN